MSTNLSSSIRTRRLFDAGRKGGVVEALGGAASLLLDRRLFKYACNAAEYLGGIFLKKPTRRGWHSKTHPSKKKAPLVVRLFFQLCAVEAPPLHKRCCWCFFFQKQNNFETWFFYLPDFFFCSIVCCPKKNPDIHFSFYKQKVFRSSFGFFCCAWVFVQNASGLYLFVRRMDLNGAFCF